MGEATDGRTTPRQVFAYLVSKCASGLVDELVASGKSETQARNTVIHCFLDFASGEACRIARRESREPDPEKWRKAVDRAFARAVKRTVAPPADATESAP